MIYDIYTIYYIIVRKTTLYYLSHVVLGYDLLSSPKSGELWVRLFGSGEVNLDGAEAEKSFAAGVDTRLSNR
jgi:hypothetical protein